MKAPRISIMMPVYNGGIDLQRAIASVFKQTLQDFEVLIVDDASTDTSVKIISAFTDPRINFMQNPTNRGLTETLNIGVNAARGEYIARLDQDDFFDDPDKLRRQAQWLDQHPDCVLVGTYYTVYGPHQAPVKVTPPTEDQDIRRAFLLSATFAHPTVMFRKSTYQLVGGYRDRYGKHVEDIDLWLRLGLHGTFHILPVWGLNYTLSPGGISRKYQRSQLFSRLRLTFSSLPHWRHYPSLPAAFRKSLIRSILTLIVIIIEPIRGKKRS